MKKLLMTAAALIAFAAPAQADTLPASFLGEWCAYPDDLYSARDGSYSARDPGENCLGRLTMKQRGFVKYESCRFRSVKKTNDLRPNHTQATKADWTPAPYSDIGPHAAKSRLLNSERFRSVPRTG